MALIFHEYADNTIELELEGVAYPLHVFGSESYPVEGSYHGDYQLQLEDVIWYGDTISGLARRLVDYVGRNPEDYESALNVLYWTWDAEV